MTVKELIEELSKYPPNTIVVVNMGLNELANGSEASMVDPVLAYSEKDKSWGYPNRTKWYLDYYPEVDSEEKSSEIVVNITS